jgi:hypothetical protein
VDLRPTTDPGVTLRQLQSSGITHWLALDHGVSFPAISRTACFELIRDFEGRIVQSRTLRQTSTPLIFSLYRLNPACSILSSERADFRHN